MRGDTSLLRMVMEGLVKKYNWTYDETLDRFYKSNLCKRLSDRATGVFTFCPREIIEELEEELGFIN